MKCIQTKYLGPTEFFGSRIKSWVEGTDFKITIDYQYDMQIVDLHFLAAQELVKKYNLDWNISTMVVGFMSEGYVFCFPDSTITVKNYTLESIEMS
jgi:hypothetical protein